MPSVCERLIESRARGLLELFRRKGLLPRRPTLPSTFLPSSASSAMDRSNRTDATARCSKRQAHMNASLTAVRPFPFSSREVRTASRSPSAEWNLSVPSCSSCLSIRQLRRIGCGCQDNVLILITGTIGSGIAVLDLSSVPEPGPLPYVAGVSTAAKTLRDSSARSPHISIPANGRLAPTQRIVPHLIRPGRVPQ